MVAVTGPGEITAAIATTKENTKTEASDSVDKFYVQGRSVILLEAPHRAGFRAEVGKRSREVGPKRFLRIAEDLGRRVSYILICGGPLD